MTWNQVVKYHYQSYIQSPIQQNLLSTYCCQALSKVLEIQRKQKKQGPTPVKLINSQRNIDNKQGNHVIDYFSPLSSMNKIQKLLEIFECRGYYVSYSGQEKPLRRGDV